MRTANMIYGNLKLPVYFDAPADGKTYGRKNKGWSEVLINQNYLKEWQGWTFEDVVPGTAKTYVIHLKAKFGYTIDSIVLQTDDGTLTGCSLKINGTAVTGMSSLTITTTIAETNATGANIVAAGDKVTFEITTGYTGAPTLVHGLINYTKS